MAHIHTHGAASQNDTYDARLFLALVLAAAYMFAEVIGGWLSNSLALLADAAHMFSDVAALSISLAAVRMARRPPTAAHTYGYHRAEALGALVNALALVAVAGGILLEAYHRLHEPVAVQALMAASVATGGLVVNALALAVLGGGRHANLSVRGAWLHVLGDTLGSLAAISGALLVWAFGWYWADPLASILIALIVVFSALRLLRDVVDVLMEGTPVGIDVGQVRQAILELPGVDEVHDLHVWTIGSGLPALTGHVVVDPAVGGNEVLSRAAAVLSSRFGIDHTTIQVEREGFEENGSCH